MVTKMRERIKEIKEEFYFILTFTLFLPVLLLIWIAFLIKGEGFISEEWK